MRHLIETGVLFERDGRWVLGADGRTRSACPRASRRCSRGRLGAPVGGLPRRRSPTAAVLGREFRFDVLRAMASGRRGGADRRARGGARRAARRRDRRRRGPAYAFTHALVRETLYGGARAGRAASGCTRAAARAIEAVEGDGAGRGARRAPPARRRRPGDAAKAVEYSLRAGAAGARAVRLGRGRGPLGRRAGRDGARRRPARPSARGCSSALADLMVVVGDLGRQIAYLEQALALYEQLGDERAGRAGALAARHGATR